MLPSHSLIVIYKTAFYSFYLPVALAFILCGFPRSHPSEASDVYKLSLDIFIPLGEYFQIQDDYLDYAGSPERIGKIGTDIVDNKCSWCVNTAIEHATPEQYAVLYENYGRKDRDSERRVKEVYDQVGLHARFAAYEKSAYERISRLIDGLPEISNPAGDATLRKEVFTAFLNKVHKRAK